MKKVKVLIAMPSGGSQKTIFSQSLMNMWNYTSQFEDIDLSLRIEIAPYICRNRCALADVALTNNHDYMLFLDNDMLFPAEMLVHLLKHDVDIVTTNYVTKNIPARYMCVETEDGDNKKGRMVITKKESAGLEEVDLAPTGTMLIKTDVLRNIKRPWFFVPPREGEAGEEMKVFLEKEYNWTLSSGGEDYWFCHLAKLAGYKVWCDHDLSKIVSHIGDYPYSYIDGWRADEYTQKRYNLASPNTMFLLRGDEKGK